jgi:phosphatidate cytidylyltransferase
MAERNFVLRILSALVGLPLVGLLVFWREPLGFGLLALLATGVALWELGRLTLPDARPVHVASLVFLGTAFATGVYLRPGLAHLWLLAAVLLLGLLVLFAGGELKSRTVRLGMSGFGIFYVGGLLMALPLMHRDLPDGSLWVATAIAVTFVNDTGAYFVGRTIGRHKLAPAISPGKTVEGAVGGLVFGVAFMFVARATYFPALTVLDALVIGVAGGILGPSGDLLESMFKRAVGAKDSGNIIPGHGGVLDRIDALLFVGAYIYLHATLFR